LPVSAAQRLRFLQTPFLFRLFRACALPRSGAKGVKGEKRKYKISAYQVFRKFPLRGIILFLIKSIYIACCLIMEY
jgi:hypothetical protein